MDDAKMPTVVEPQNQVMTLIERVALDPAFDITKMQALVAMRNADQDRQTALEEAREAKAAKRLYNIAFVEMKPKLPKVLRTKRNEHAKFNYAPLDQINTEIDPILAPAGFGTSSKLISQTDGTVTVLVSVIHIGGHSESMEITMPLDNKGPGGTVNKTLPDAIASSITRCKRIGVCALLNISTGEDEGGGAVRDADKIAVEQAADLDTRARALGDDYHKRFLDWLGAETAVEIMARDYKKAITGLEKAEKKKAAQNV